METVADLPPALDAKPSLRGANEHYCENCGNLIPSKLPNCPHCHAKQKSGLDKPSLILITLFFGALGGHKFYLKRYGMGIFYFLFSWTGLTFIGMIIELIIYAATDTEKLREKYPEVNNLAPVIVIPVVGYAVFMIGILAAIAVPNFISYRMKAYDKTAETAAHSAYYAAQAYFAEKPEGAASVENLIQYGYSATAGVKIVIDPNTYEELMIRAYHPSGRTMYTIDAYGQQSKMEKPRDYALPE
ncbi:TM2 domain-containing protein [Desulfatibacillum alkenivorans DSM 16219]|uniref:TM2 domain-containing protein n=1 Tax=Desulfatibacillum alkenivorans DSM 16219 TaxID=1121393 RepID=A0A1M6CH71_9BACT|nr:TM2 domain-containing protein [Desulfatibacillum alkenivorans]SHI60380.1 TM2 domain-containing protein [Desulfatibacillum alkenivorans DSM 16219]